MSQPVRTRKKSTASADRKEMNELRAYMGTLCQMMVQLADVKTAEAYKERAFDQLCVQLEPLRPIGPERTSPAKDQWLRLAMIRRSLARPDWTRIGGLKVPQLAVAFIGQFAPDSPGAAYHGSRTS